MELHVRSMVPDRFLDHDTYSIFGRVVTHIDSDGKGLYALCGEWIPKDPDAPPMVLDESCVTLYVAAKERETKRYVWAMVCSYIGPTLMYRAFYDLDNYDDVKRAIVGAVRAQLRDVRNSEKAKFNADMTAWFAQMSQSRP